MPWLNKRRKNVEPTKENDIENVEVKAYNTHERTDRVIGEEKMSEKKFQEIKEQDNHAFLFGDIRFSAEQSGVEESSSSNKCSVQLKSFSVIDTQTGQKTKFIQVGGDTTRARVRNKVKAFCKYTFAEKYESGNRKTGLFHWVFGTNWLIEDWEKYNKAIQALGRLFEGQYIIVIELGEVGKRLHAHILLNRYYRVECLRAAWEWITGIEGVHVEARYGDVGASNYLSKYVSKDKEIRRGRRLFRCSEGLEKQIENYFEKKEGKMYICIE